MKHFLAFLIIFSCLAISCETPKDAIKPDNLSIPTDGSLAIIYAIYEMEVVNNTDTSVEINNDYFGYSEKYGISISGSPTHGKSLTVEGNTTETMYFFWHPRFRTYPSDTLPPPGTPLPPLPSIEEQMEEYYPCIQSFYLRIRMDDDERYLAGWPRSLELPSLIGPNYADFTLDTDRIVQYGIGYGEMETRIRHNIPVDRSWLGGDIEYYDRVYSPFIISIDNDGKTEKHDFDNALTVLGKAVLTIDGPDKIKFITTELWEPKYGDPELDEFQSRLR